MESVGCTPDRKAREILHNVSLILRQRLGCEFFTLHVLSFLSMRKTTVKPSFFFCFFFFLQIFESCGKSTLHGLLLVLVGTNKY
jgi:hypothetical protein